MLSHGKEGDRQFVTALARGLEILRCFSPQQRELSVSELAHATKLPQATAWRLCYTLQELGYLVPTRGGTKLQLGTTVLTLGYAVFATLDIAEIARPEMQSIADRYRAAVALAARDRLDMLLLQRCHGDSVLLMNLHVGSRVPVAVSALGWAYLAGLSQADREELMRTVRAENPEQWSRVKEPILSAMRQYGSHGYVLNQRVFNPEVNAVAVPVISSDGSRVLSLNCGGPANQLSPKVLQNEIAPRLMQLAASLEVVLVPAETGLRAHAEN